jgi:hypothetical protein
VKEIPMSLSLLRGPVAVAVLAMACGAPDDSPVAPAPAIPSLSLVGGDNQESVPGEELASPLRVRVSHPTSSAAGIRVTWRVESGSGAFRHSAVTVTDAAGEAWVHFTPATHRVAVSAAIDGAAGSVVLFRTVPRPLGVYFRIPPPSGCGGGPSCEEYTLFPDDTFVLRYPQGFAYEGTFSRLDSVLSLSFREPTWRATATLRGDSLVVVYNANASLSDFENGTFVRGR